MEEVQQHFHYVQLSEQTDLVYSPINDHVDVAISGTPANQSSAVLEVTGGPKGTLLTAP